MADVRLPLRLKLLKDFALRVVANGARLDEAAQIELFGSEHRHFGGVSLLEERMLGKVSMVGADFGWESWLIISPRFNRTAHPALGDRSDAAVSTSSAA